MCVAITIKKSPIPALMLLKAKQRTHVTSASTTIPGDFSGFYESNLEVVSLSRDAFQNSLEYVVNFTIVLPAAQQTKKRNSLFQILISIYLKHCKTIAIYVRGRGSGHIKQDVGATQNTSELTVKHL